MQPRYDRCLLILHAHGILQSGETALHYACKSGFEEIASLLIAQGAPVWPRNQAGMTALEIAVEAGFEDIAIMLEENAIRVTDV